MNLTNEQIEQILESAEEFEGLATHYDVTWGYLYYDTHCIYFDGEYWTELGIVPKQVHSLSDLREILTLRQRVKELEDNHAKACGERLAENRQLKPCYECGTLVHELSPRSRCCMCEYNRAIFNEEENNQLRGQDDE